MTLLVQDVCGKTSGGKLMHKRSFYVGEASATNVSKLD